MILYEKKRGREVVGEKCRKQRTAGWCEAGKREESYHLQAAGMNRFSVVPAGFLTVKREPIHQKVWGCTERGLEREAGLPATEVVTRRILDPSSSRGAIPVKMRDFLFHRKVRWNFPVKQKGTACQRCALARR